MTKVKEIFDKMFMDKDLDNDNSYKKIFRVENLFLLIALIGSIYAYKNYTCLNSGGIYLNHGECFHLEHKVSKYTTTLYLKDNGILNVSRYVNGTWSKNIFANDNDNLSNNLTITKQVAVI